MITCKRAKRIVEVAVAHGEGRSSGVEVSIFAVDDATARFANNEMTQHVSTEGATITVRAIVAGRTAVMTSDNLSFANVRKLVDRAIEMTAQLPHDPTTLKLLKPGDNTQELTKTSGRYDSKVAAFGPVERRKAVQSIIKVAKSKRQLAAGIVARRIKFFAVGNSNGLFRCDRQTEFECSITMKTASSSGWQKGFASSVDLVSPRTLAEIAANKAARSRNPIYVRPGLYTVILEPSAVLDLIGFIWEDLTGDAHNEETSSFTGEIGDKVLGDNITIVDDAYHELQCGFTFDDEGMTRKRVVLVKNGVIKSPVKSRRSAINLGGSPTGHGCAPVAAESETPLNLVIAGGDQSLEEMVASTERGILMTRVWYVRDVDPNTKLLTGMTRDGTFLIEGGKVKRGIKNLRFNQSVLEMLKHVVALGPAVLAAGEETFPAVVPPMKIEGFRFSSRTKA